MIEVAITNEQSTHSFDQRRLRRAVGMIIEDHHFSEAAISVAVVDDPTIHQLNQRYLHHDYPTDVLSFMLDLTEDFLDGEVIVSADTAAASAVQYGWRFEDELLLYVIHGTLHLVGMNDKSPAESRQMREAEAKYLGHFELVPHTQEKNALDETLTRPVTAWEGELKR